MAASAGEVSRQLVNTMPKATSGMGGDGVS